MGQPRVYMVGRGCKLNSVVTREIERRLVSKKLKHVIKNRIEFQIYVFQIQKKKLKTTYLYEYKLNRIAFKLYTSMPFKWNQLAFFSFFYTYNMVMARDGLLPEWFARVHPKLGTPANATAFTGITTGLLALLVDIDILAELVSIGTLAGPSFFEHHIFFIYDIFCTF